MHRKWIWHLGQAVITVPAPVLPASARRCIWISLEQLEQFIQPVVPQHTPFSLERSISLSSMPGIAFRSSLGAS